jgi:hypothetical protein
VDGDQLAAAAPVHEGYGREAGSAGLLRHHAV